MLPQTTLSSGWLYWDCDLSIIAQIKEKGPGSVEALPACSVRRPHAGGKLHRLCPQPALSRTPELVEEASWAPLFAGDTSSPLVANLPAWLPRAADAVLW